MIKKITDDQKIDEIINSFSNYALGDIEVIKNKKLLIATFILCACFIDQMAQHRYFDKNRPDSNSGKHFKDFIKDYFHQDYKPLAEDLYKFLRCKLVHNYSILGEIKITDGYSREHLVKQSNGETYINMYRFIDDLRDAFYRFERDIRFVQNIRQLAIDHYNRWGIVTQSS